MEPKERFPPDPLPRKANRGGLWFYANALNVSTFNQIVVYKNGLPDMKMRGSLFLCRILEICC